MVFARDSMGKPPFFFGSIPQVLNLPENAIRAQGAVPWGQTQQRGHQMMGLTCGLFGVFVGDEMITTKF